LALPWLFQGRVDSPLGEGSKDPFRLLFPAGHILPLPNSVLSLDQDAFCFLRLRRSSRYASIPYFFFRDLFSPTHPLSEERHLVAAWMFRWTSLVFSHPISNGPQNAWGLMIGRFPPLPVEFGRTSAGTLFLKETGRKFFPGKLPNSLPSRCERRSFFETTIRTKPMCPVSVDILSPHPVLPLRGSLLSLSGFFPVTGL